MKSRILVCVCGADGKKPRYNRVFTGTILGYDERHLSTRSRLEVNDSKICNGLQCLRKGCHVVFILVLYVLFYSPTRKKSQCLKRWQGLTQSRFNPSFSPPLCLALCSRQILAPYFTHLRRALSRKIGKSLSSVPPWKPSKISLPMPRFRRSRTLTHLSYPYQRRLMANPGRSL